MKKLVIILCFFTTLAEAKLSETAISIIPVETTEAYSNEADALEAAFLLEGQLQNPRSEEFDKLKKICDRFISLLKPTVVRLRVDGNQKVKGIVEAKIRCKR
ncbi:MAG TPA: hypothetical protein VKY27_11275 [Bacteriovoracaceae bacterium]|nr:hypothetical protein [Bacteriovoracaceae bacterium]